MCLRGDMVDASNNDTPPHISVDKDWQIRRESRVIMNCLFRRRARIQFGLLEHLNPTSPLAKTPTKHNCKILLYGKAGVGKTSTVLKLSGRVIPKTHIETLGIQTSVTYWPAKLTNSEEIVLLNLEFWDTGEKALRKFDHILPSMISSTNTIAFFFSYTDHNSWNELPNIIEQAIMTRKIDSHLKIVIGTKMDSSSPKITPEEVKEFEKKNNINVLSISNINQVLLTNGWPDGLLELSDIAPFLNKLTELVINHQTINQLTSRTSELEITDALK